MNDELIDFKTVKLANEKGFIPKNLSISWKLDSYLWLCELQKWLREVHSINVYCNPCQHDENLWYNNIASHNLVFIGKYEQALEVGLYQALLLINP
jgi:hypothetical protein